MRSQNDTKPSSITGSISPESAFTPDEYFHYFEGEDITEAQMREFLTLYWSIIVECVALGLDLTPSPAPTPEKACGQLLESPAERRIEGDSAVEWTKPDIQTALERAARATPNGKPRGGKDLTP
jgi:hypothetical protein